MSKQAREILREGVRRSWTFRQLVDRIERSDLIVYVQLGPLKPGLLGSTQLIGASPFARFVLVTIKPMAPVQELLSRLGHELQHATEIADAPGVRDDDDVGQLFRRIGWATGSGRWETDAAVSLGRRVLSESLARPQASASFAQAR